MTGLFGRWKVAVLRQNLVHPKILDVTVNKRDETLSTVAPDK
jgi:hypothetical protein